MKPAGTLKQATQPKRLWPGTKEVVAQSDPLQALLEGAARRLAAKASAAAIFVLLATAAAAQEKPQSLAAFAIQTDKAPAIHVVLDKDLNTGDKTVLAARVTKALQQMRLVSAWELNDWRVIVVSAPTWEWAEQAAARKGIYTNQGFTFTQTKTTYLSSKYISLNDDKELRLLLGHEAAHIICGCDDERKAERLGHTLAGVK